MAHEEFMNPDDFQRNQKDSRPSKVTTITQDEFDSILAENRISRKIRDNFLGV